MKKRFTLFLGLILLIQAPLFYMQGGRYIFTLVLTGGLLTLGFYFFKTRHQIEKLMYSRIFQNEANQIITCIFAFLLFIFAGYLLKNWDIKWDLTANSRFTLPKETRHALDQLQEPLKVTGFYRKTDKDEFYKLFKLINDYSEMVQLQLVDPIAKPLIAKQFQIKQTKTLHFKYQDFTTFVVNPNLSKITTALLKVLRKETKSLYFIEGHGERKLSKELTILADQLAKSNYHVRPLNLAKQLEIPSNASLVVIPGPTNKITEVELGILESYLAKGGMLVILLEPLIDSGLQKLLQSHYIKQNQHEIITLPPESQRARLQKGNYLLLPALPNPRHVVTGQIISSLVAYTAKPLYPEVKHKKLISLLYAPPYSWAEKDPYKKPIKFDSKRDIKQPTIAILSEIKVGKLAVVGDVDLLTNKLINNPHNSEFFLNLVSYLMDDHRLINFHPQSKNFGIIGIGPAALATFYYVLVFVFPIGILISGITIWSRRRNQ